VGTRTFPTAPRPRDSWGPLEDTVPVCRLAFPSYPGGNHSHFQTFKEDLLGPNQGVSRVYYGKSLVFCQAHPVQ
jgi:hypothetical protein